MGDLPRVTAVVVAYNGGVDLRLCVESLLTQTLNDLEIIVVDNASTDGSLDLLEAQFNDRIRTIRRPTNGGYAAGANTGWRAATTEVVTILNQDLVLMPNCLEEMRKVFVESKREAFVTPKILLKSDPTRVNALGNDVHFSGVAWCHGLGTPAADWHGVIEVIAISGAAFMGRHAFFEMLGGIEESYFMYMEDVDLSLRARLSGATCLGACDAVAIHDWNLRLPVDRFELLERNRRALWRRFWSASPRMYPLLVQAESMAWLYAVTHGLGHIRAKVRAAKWQPRLTTPATSSAALYPVLARSHPYGIVFPATPVVSAIGQIADRLFAAFIPSGRKPTDATLPR